jgi:hypothetical protein
MTEAGVDLILDYKHLASKDLDNLVALLETDTFAEPSGGHRLIVGLVEHEGLDGHGARLGLIA